MTVSVLVSTAPRAVVVKKPRTWKRNRYRPGGGSNCSDMASLERRNYCRDCEWSATTAEYNTQELGRRVLGHTIETGHDIDSEIIRE